MLASMPQLLCIPAQLALTTLGALEPFKLCCVVLVPDDVERRPQVMQKKKLECCQQVRF